MDARVGPLLKTVPVSCRFSDLISLHFTDLGRPKRRTPTLREGFCLSFHYSSESLAAIPGGVLGSQAVPVRIQQVSGVVPGDGKSPFH